MPHDPYKALYIHIPFCISRCFYCDFCTQVQDADSPLVGEYAENLISEIRSLSKRGELAEIETVYIGGGTPTHISPKLISLIYTLGLSMNVDSLSEFTVEANPESLNERLVCDMWSLGVSRLSLGVQTFDDEILKRIGRAHDSKRAHEAIVQAKSRFDNISVDLMCGLPGQTVESFKSDVCRCIDYGIPHISIYPLTIEPHTPFANMVRAGEMDDVDEDMQADMMQAAERMLLDAGFHRYEVASYARDGFESKHNCSYWTGKPYLGIGLSATTMTQDGSRRMRVQDGQVVDDLDYGQMLLEDVMLGMRMSRGVSDELANRACKAVPNLSSVLSDLARLGLIVHDSGRYRPTERGWICGNELYGAILDA